eukprot:CAMPEP_0202453988 /NCGR_PEP_ID=MMETSP1360-20130828/11830_1 /ASSEMBLY_ACC=CAM_ASM_000848 /TAXON_ID=515479 /ORGANISM="Licmophora paradoxa, Strain CCMP2313" /LENGTH=449 /DNA_ID=CAMNT_0049073199 /DNA_START=285 /DNA_END=1631 /DNA_ORIENTATION=+
MEAAVKRDLKLSAQWLRLAFHDAGTFNQQSREGGANGCLLTHRPMRDEDENLHLDLPINTLVVIKRNWENHANTCIRVSSADMIQFAGFFSSLRQVGASPGLTSPKRGQLNTFKWGRPDKVSCSTAWTRNLPGFQLGNDHKGVSMRCKMAGVEIEEKLMKRNGFTAEEACALIGAHTIGLTRNTFGRSLAGPWVTNGKDDATPNGPIFDNAYFDFLENSIPAKTAAEFELDISPFTDPFPDWFRDTPRDLNHLDTDLALAFPVHGGTGHPDFHQFTVKFSKDNALFLTKFFEALNKMSKLGVRAPLFFPHSCTSCFRRLSSNAISPSMMMELDNIEDATVITEKSDDSDDDKENKRSNILKKVEIPSGLFEDLKRATKVAKILNERKQSKRKAEIKRLTTLVEELKSVVADLYDEHAQADVDAQFDRLKVAEQQAEDFLLEKEVQQTQC